MVIQFLLHSAFLYRKLHTFETLKINCNAIFLRLKREEKTIVSMCLWHIHVVLFSLSSLVTVKAVMAILGKWHAIEERVNWLQGKLNRSHKYNFLPMGFCVPLDTYETSQRHYTVTRPSPENGWPKVDRCTHQIQVMFVIAHSAQVSNNIWQQLWCRVKGFNNRFLHIFAIRQQPNRQTDASHFESQLRFCAKHSSNVFIQAQFRLQICCYSGESIAKRSAERTFVM